MLPFIVMENVLFHLMLIWMPPIMPLFKLWYALFLWVWKWFIKQALYNSAVQKSIYLQLSMCYLFSRTAGCFYSPDNCWYSQEAQVSCRSNRESRMGRDSARKIGVVTESSWSVLMCPLQCDKPGRFHGLFLTKQFISNHCKNIDWYLHWI